jgi:hypothetical protein
LLHKNLRKKTTISPIVVQMIAGKGLTVWQGHHFVWDKSVAVENYVRFSPDLRNRRNLRFQIRNIDGY